MSFIGIIVGLAVVGSLLAICLWILYYHYHNRRLGLTNQPFLPPLPSFRKKKSSRGITGRGVDLEEGSRPYEGLGGDEAWDAREEYEGARLHAGPSARGFDGQEERRYGDDDGLENPFGDDGNKKPENPFGSGARRVEDESTTTTGGDMGRGLSGGGPQGSRRSLFNEDI
jgi:hypothetical protein